MDEGLKTCMGMSKSTFKVTQINGRDAVVLSIFEALNNHRDDKDASYGSVMPQSINQSIIYL